MSTADNLRKYKTAKRQSRIRAKEAQNVPLKTCSSIHI
jgi:hypothetical protein